MGYVFLTVSIVANTVWALCYKVAVRRKCNLDSVNLILQIAATLVLVAFWGATGARYHPGVVILAILTGIGMCISSFTFFHHMKTGVLAVSWTVIGLALVFPVLASVLVWHEQPTPKQYIGLALIPVAFVCFGGNGKADEPK